jgi:mannose/fructose/N-acetylgalactosamine-specific phosphotransferase system component IID
MNNPVPAKKITGSDLFNMMWRSFYIQAVWNFERLQNLGFLFCVIPMIKRLYPEKKDRIPALNRHLEFFNTHPYMASIVLGVVISMEERMANDPDAVKPEDIRSLKAIMSGPLAAIGDTFFWATLRPFSALLGVTLVLLLEGNNMLAGPLLFLFFFNIFGVYMRFGGLLKGYRLGTKVVDTIKKFDTQELIAVVNLLGMIVLGVLLIIYMFGLTLWPNIVFASTFVLAYGLIRKKVPTTFLIYGALVCAIILSYAGFTF